MPRKTKRQLKKCPCSDLSPWRIKAHRIFGLVLLNLTVWFLCWDVLTHLPPRTPLVFTNPNIVRAETKEPVVEEQRIAPETKIEMQARIANEEGVPPKMLRAIGVLESGEGKKMVGDNGLSRGWYHIYFVNTCEHKQTAKCIKAEDRMDFEKSTRWVAKRLKAHEALGEYEQIRSHNGLVGDNDGDGVVDNAFYVAHIKRIISEL